MEEEEEVFRKIPFLHDEIETEVMSQQIANIIEMLTSDLLGFYHEKSDFFLDIPPLQRLDDLCLLHYIEELSKLDITKELVTFIQDNKINIDNYPNVKLLFDEMKC